MTTPAIYTAMRSFGPITTPDGHYFAMSDNRDNSTDSRVWGVADRNQIVGRAVGIAMSFDPAGTLSPRWDRFFRSLPPDRFPALVALGEHVWVDNRDERFTAGLNVLVDGLEHARTSATAEEGQA